MQGNVGQGLKINVVDESVFLVGSFGFLIFFSSLVVFGSSVEDMPPLRTKLNLIASQLSSTSTLQQDVHFVGAIP